VLNSELKSKPVISHKSLSNGEEGLGTIGIIVQARMGSSRLPGKVLRQTRGKPMLQYLLESLLQANLGTIVIATSDHIDDLGIVALGDSLGIQCLRGSETDVASRFVSILSKFCFGTFARVCADSPLLDTDLLKQAILKFSSKNFDLVTNTQPRRYPKGQSVEILSSHAFLKAHGDFAEGADFEHVTHYFYTHSEKFRIGHLSCENDFGGVQLSVDTLEDFLGFEALVAKTDRPHWEYRWTDWVGMLSADGPSGSSIS
jgi:spore coat polysaccharide biosynthesis protein SpsF